MDLKEVVKYVVPKNTLRIALASSEAKINDFLVLGLFFEDFGAMLMKLTTFYL
jgi:hypothetical protein